LTDAFAEYLRWHLPLTLARYRPPWEISLAAGMEREFHASVERFIGAGQER
jgi:hypothetical protein